MVPFVTTSAFPMTPTGDPAPRATKHGNRQHGAPLPNRLLGRDLGGKGGRPTRRGNQGLAMSSRATMALTRGGSPRGGAMNPMWRGNQELVAPPRATAPPSGVDGLATASAGEAQAWRSAGARWLVPPALTARRSASSGGSSPPWHQLHGSSSRGGGHRPDAAGSQRMATPRTCDGSSLR